MKRLILIPIIILLVALSACSPDNSKEETVSEATTVSYENTDKPESSSFVDPFFDPGELPPVQ